MVAAAGLLPRTPAVLLVLVTLGAVSWSFGQSVAWLWRARGRRSGDGARAVVLPGPITEPAR